MTAIKSGNTIVCKKCTFSHPLSSFTLSSIWIHALTYYDMQKEEKKHFSRLTPTELFNLLKAYCFLSCMSRSQGNTFQKTYQPKMKKQIERDEKTKTNQKIPENPFEFPFYPHNSKPKHKTSNSMWNDFSFSYQIQKYQQLSWHNLGISIDSFSSDWTIQG